MEAGADTMSRSPAARTLLALLGCAAVIGALAVVLLRSDEKARGPAPKATPKPAATPTPDPTNEVTDPAVRAAFERPVDFAFNDQPLTEVLEHFHELTGLKFVLDPRVGDPPVALEVRQMRFGTALRWLVTLQGLDYVVRDGAIHIIPGRTEE